MHEEYQSVMLNEKNMQKYLKHTFAFSMKPRSKPVPTCDTINHLQNKPRHELFFPREKDTLFWCFYRMWKGEIEYEFLMHKNALVAKQWKIEYISKIRENKLLLKMYKFDTLSNIESNLVNDEQIHLNTFLTLCVLENINVIYVCKQSFFELQMNDSNNVYIIHKMQHKYGNKYGYEAGTNEKINHIREHFYHIQCVNKPVKGLSYYKVADLQEIASKLGIETAGKIKKELHDAIVDYFAN